MDSDLDQDMTNLSREMIRRVRGGTHGLGADVLFRIWFKVILLE
jgi:hypothetical protein